jgi:sec-independent protein translocase protein TatC
MQPQRAFVDPYTLAKLTQQSSLSPPPEAEPQSATDSTDQNPVNQEELAKKLDLNPWKDMELKRLNQLQPLVLWQSIPNKLNALTSMEPFMIYLKTGLVAGFIFGAPGIFWHIWQFFAAGLYPHERRYVYWYIPLSLSLFFAGVALAFFVIFKFVLEFLIGYSSSLDVEFTPRLNDYMSFAILLPLGFGLAFQLPIVMLGLHRFGLVSAETFMAQWRVAVLIISFLSMLLTPGGDPYSMGGMAIPLVFLYFFGILLCRYMPKGAGIGSPALDP